MDWRDNDVACVDRHDNGNACEGSLDTGNTCEGSHDNDICDSHDNDNACKGSNDNDNTCGVSHDDDTVGIAMLVIIGLPVRMAMIRVPMITLIPMVLTVLTMRASLMYDVHCLAS